MTIRHLQIFIEVYRTGSVTKAAERLHLSQPAVSNAIKELETYYGVMLFERMNRKIYITKAGLLLWQYANSILSQLEEVREIIRDEESTSGIRIGSNVAFGSLYLPAILSDFCKKYPDIPIFTRIENSSRMEKAVLHNELDFAIVEGSFDQQVYEGLVYYTQRFIPVAAPDYSFSGPVHRMADLLEARLLVREPGSGTRGVLEQALEARNLNVHSFRYLTELGSLNLIKSLVCAGAGISFFYQPVVQAELDRGDLVEIPLEDGEIRHDFTFLWRRGSAFAPYYREMFRLLRQN